MRLQGTNPNPSAMKDFPIVTASGVVPLGAIAELTRTREEAGEIVTYEGRPAILLTVTKNPDANVLELVDIVNKYLDNRNRFKDATGVELILADDQTVSTRQALKIMQTNALIGLSPGPARHLVISGDPDLLTDHHRYPFHTLRHLSRPQRQWFFHK